jgi:gliding motility-associated-like protein
MSSRIGRKVYIILLLIVLICQQAMAQPSVIGHPQNASICVDANASFTVTAVNTAAYQWQENDGVGWYNITGSITYAQGFNTPTLSINDANIGLNGYQYRCIVYDAQNNQDISDPATLGVYDPPIIINQPVNNRVCKNEIAQFEVESLYGTVYRWQENIGAGWVNLNDNAFYTGTNTPILSIFTTTGMNGLNFRCVVNNVSCPEISNNATLFVDPTPIIYDVTGGGSYCAGGQGVEIGLSASETGISYVVYRNNNNTGQVVDGNGDAINFGIFTQEGQYTVKAINGFTTCEILMNGTAEVVINPLPQQQVFAGGGQFCAGSTPPELYLQGTEQGVVYTLYRNGANTGISLVGNGFTMSFGRFSEPGTYSVQAVNSTTECTIQLTNTINISSNELPIAIAGDNQTIVAGNIATLNGTALPGTGNYLYNWQPTNLVMQPGSQQSNTIPLYQTSLFKLQVTDLQTGCQSLADSLVVQVADGPLTVQLIASQNTICPGESTNILALTGGGTGNYNWTWSSLPGGFNASSQEVTVLPNQSGLYIVHVNDGLTTVSDTVGIDVLPIPATQQLNGGGSYCAGGNGLAVGLSGSEPGVVYKLYHNNLQIAEKTGTGQAINFGTYNQVGDYTAIASYANSNCTINMSGPVSISINPKPVAAAGANQYITAGAQTSLSGSADGGSGNYSFNWTPVDFLLNPNSQNPATLPLSSTQLFNLVVTDQQTTCQSETDQTVVFVSGGDLSLNIGASAYSICKGESVQLIALPSGGSANYSYLWQSQPPGFVSNLFNPTVNPQQTTTYSITITDGFQLLTDSVTITMRPSPEQFQLVGGGSYCEGGQGKEIKLQSSQSEAIYTLFRNGSPTANQLQGNGGELDFGFQTIAGQYTALGNNTLSLCQAEMNGTVSVQVQTVPVVNAGPDRTIQTGQSSNLNGQVSSGSGSYGFSWQPVSVVVNPSSQQTLSQPLSNTTLFTFGAIDNQSGCQSIRDTVMVYVGGGPLHANASANNQQGCAGAPISLLGIASGGTGNYQYQWTSIPAGYYANQQNVNVSPQESLSYILTVSDGQQIARDTIDIAISESPLRFQLDGGGNLCQASQSVPIGLNGSQQGITYYLYRNEIETAIINGTGSPISFGLFSQPGVYTAYGEVTGAGCSSQMVGQAEIQISGRPIANAGPDSYLMEGGQLTLEGTVTGGSGQYLFSWTPANKLINPDALQPTTSPLFETTVFKLDITDQSTGCTAMADYVALFVGGDSFNVETYASTDGECAGEAVQLFALPTGGSGNYSYLWLSNPPGFAAETYNPIAYPTESTMYKVLVNDGQTIIEDSVFVTVESAIETYELIGGGSICSNGQGAEVGLSGSQTDTEYKLYRNNQFTGISLSGNGFPVSFGYFNQSGTYTATADNILSGCSLQMPGEVVIDVHPTPVASAGAYQTIPFGEITTLNGNASGASGFYDYFWSPTYLLDDPFVANPSTIALENTSLFLFYVADSITGCTSQTDTTIVFVSGGPLGLQLLANNTHICEGDQVSLLAVPSGGSGNYEIRWTDQAGNLMHQGQDWNITLWETTTLFVELLDGDQQINDSITIYTAAVPQAFQLTGGGATCQGGEGLTIGLSGSETGIMYDLYLNQIQLITSVQGQGTAIGFGSFTQEGNYTVKARRAGYNCERLMNGSAVVQVLPSPTAYAGEDQFISLGAQAQLQGLAGQGSGQYSFRWEPAALVTNPNTQNTTTQSLYHSTMFTLKVTDAQTSCYQTDQTIVYLEGGALNLQIMASESIVCPGQSVLLTALPGGGSGNYSYEWHSIPEGLQSNAPGVKVYPATNTWYYVTVNDGESSITDSVRITTHQLPQVFTLSGGGNYCAGDSPEPILLSNSQTGITYDLMRNGNYTGISRAGTGAPLNFGQVYAEGNYTILATNQNGCKALMQNLVIIRQGSPPAVFWLLGGGEICEGEATGFYLSGSEINTNYELLLNQESTGTIVPGTGNPINFDNPRTSGVFTVTASHAGSSCYSPMNGAASLLLFPNPIASISGAGSVCLGDSILLRATGGESYYWETNPPLSTAEIVVWPDQNTEYSVLVTNSFGCQDRASQMVVVNPLPDFEIVDSPNNQTITVETTGIQQIAFYSGDELLQSGLSNSFYYGNKSLPDNRILVEVTNEHGCTESATIEVLPVSDVNAFTPNNDGINDRFMEGSYIRVYSRWGKELFVGDTGWDGTYDGELVAPGTYYYVHEIKDLNGNLIQTRKGSVTLVVE